MSKVLTLCILLAVFAMLLPFLAEATPPLDATVQPAMEAGPVEFLTMENVAVTEAPSIEAEQPNRDERPRAEAETTYTTNKATAVERGGRDCTRPGGETRH